MLALWCGSSITLLFSHFHLILQQSTTTFLETLAFSIVVPRPIRSVQMQTAVLSVLCYFEFCIALHSGSDVTLHLQPTSILYCLRYQRNETIVSRGNPNHNRHKRIFSWQLLGTKMLLEYIKYYINLVEMGTFSICYVFMDHTHARM